MYYYITFLILILFKNPYLSGLESDFRGCLFLGRMKMQIFNNFMSTLGYLLFVLGIPTMFVLSLTQISHRANILLVNTPNLGFYSQIYFGFIGIIIHELSHLIMAIIFGHHIERVALIRIPREHDPDTALGRVSHSWKVDSIYQSIGNVFIGIAPVIGCTLVLWFLVSLTFPDVLDAIDRITNTFIANDGSLVISLDALTKVGPILSSILTFSPLTLVQIVLVLIVIANISLGGFDLSAADLSHCKYSLIQLAVILGLLIFTFLTFGLDNWLNYFLIQFLLTIIIMFLLSLVCLLLTYFCINVIHFSSKKAFQR